MRIPCEEESINLQSASDQALVRLQMERILEHNSFRNSRRYQAFLRYVVEESLNGNAAYLKERLIGVAVFKQPLDYDTNANSVVRVTAGEVRRRLAQYYLNASVADEVMIELPVGSYIPEFRAHDPTTPAENSVVMPDVALVRATEEIVHIADPLTVAVVSPAKTGPSRSLWVTIVLLCGALVITTYLALTPGGRKASEADRLWKGAFDGHDVLLCPGPLGAEKQQNQSPQQYANSGISFTISKTLGVIGSAIGRTGGNTFLLPMQDTKLEDLQRNPAVLLGAFNNEWTMRLQTPLRYQFFQNPEGSRGIIDTKDPASKRFMVNDPPTRDYGILAHFHSATTGQSTVIIGGLGTHGTAAVRIFLSSPELLEEFSKSAPSGWQKGNYEIVLSSDLVNNLADSPRVVAVSYW